MVYKNEKLEQVYNIIKTHQPISIGDVAERMKMGRSSMYPYINTLLYSSRIKKEKILTRKRGKPPIKYEVIE